MEEFLDFYQINTITLKGFGYFPIFRTYSGEYANKYMILKFKDCSDFKDFEYLDKHFMIRHVSDLYTSIVADLSVGQLELYDSEKEAIQSMFSDIVNTIFAEKTGTAVEDSVKELTCEISKLLISHK